MAEDNEYNFEDTVDEDDDQDDEHANDDDDTATTLDILEKLNRGVVREWGRNQEFLQKVRDTVTSILSRFISDDAKVLELVGDRYMMHWCLVFISEDVDPKYNYQIFELVGDSILGSLLVNWAQKAIPGKDEGFYSELRNYYASAGFIPNWTEKLGLNAAIHPSDPEIDRFVNVGKRYTDIFEAFVGAMNYVAALDMEGGDGVHPNYSAAGTILTSIFLENLFSETDFTNVDPFPPKTQVRKIIQSYYKDDTNIEVRHRLDGDVYTTTLSIPASMLSSNREPGLMKVRLNPEYSGSSPYGMKFSERQAWDKLRTHLADNGLTVESVNEKSRLALINNLPEPAKHSFANYLKKMSYLKPKLTTHHQDNGNLNHLIMIGSDGDEHIVHSSIVIRELRQPGTKPSNIQPEYEDLFMHFVTGKKSDRKKRGDGSDVKSVTFLGSTLPELLKQFEQKQSEAQRQIVEKRRVELRQKERKEREDRWDV